MQLLLVFLAIHLPKVASQGTYISKELPFHYSLTDTGSGASNDPFVMRLFIKLLIKYLFYMLLEFILIKL